MITRRRLQRLESRAEQQRNEAARQLSERDQARRLLARRLGVELSEGEYLLERSRLASTSLRKDQAHELLAMFLAESEKEPISVYQAEEGHN